VPFDQRERNPDEALRYTTPRGYEVMDFLWQQLKNSEDERHNRWLTSLTLNAHLTKGLSFRGRLGTDLTREHTVTEKYNEYPTSFNGTTSTGAYGLADANYSLLYGEGLLTYDKSFNKALDMTLRTGFQVRDERYRSTSTFTNGGLVQENWFDLKNSYFPALDIKSSESGVLKYAWLGIADVSYRDILYVQATGRLEHSSTLPPGDNSYFYPSVNSAFILSDAVDLPNWISAAKLRASAGMVGNAPPPYEANILYERTTLQTVNGPVTSVGTVGSLYGNENIRPERRVEFEAGTELWLLKDRIGLNLTYYSSHTRDQMLRLDLPGSTGASKVITNMGVLKNEGWELALSAEPVRGRFTWSGTMTVAINKTTLGSLPNGINQLVFKDLEGGSVQIVAEPGERVGNVYVHPRLADGNGNWIIGSDGTYTIDKTKYVKAGNIMPRATGGWVNRLRFKGVTFDLMIDYSLGGQIVSPALKYGTGAGLYHSTLAFRDEAHGGLAYWIDDSGKKILANGITTGQQLYHDGIILKGVTNEGQPNTTIIDAASWYQKTYDWGDNAWNEQGIIYDNSYVKVRELAVGYDFPKAITKRLGINNLRVALIGRNLFYLWRTLENLDPEATIGSSWLNQGIDDGSEAATRSYGFTVRISL
jgi:iron complex outermembrane receptor protein